MQKKIKKLTASQCQLVTDHLDYARKQAALKARNLRSQELKDSLLAAAEDGLIQAALAYKEQKGVQFKTFATFRIRGAILDRMRDYLTVSRWSHKAARVILENPDAQDTDTKFDERTRTMHSATKVQVQAAIRVQRDHESPFVYLDSPIRQADGQEGQLELPSQGKTPEETMLISEKTSVVRNALENLQMDERDKDIAIIYFMEDFRMCEIAEYFGLAESRVSQIITKAKDLLKKSSDLKILAGHSNDSPRTAEKPAQTGTRAQEIRAGMPLRIKAGVGQRLSF